MAAAIGKSEELPVRIKSILSQLGYSLGRYDLEGQLQGIRIVRRRTEESLSHIRKNRDERLRSYQTLGICAGAALAVILV
jgi:stage III sporulation protein AB